MNKEKESKKKKKWNECNLDRIGNQRQPFLYRQQNRLMLVLDDLQGIDHAVELCLKLSWIIRALLTTTGDHDATKIISLREVKIF